MVIAMLMSPWRRLCIGAAIGIAALPSLACGGKSEESAETCAHAAPPPIVAEARIMRLDVLDFGETRDVVPIEGGQRSIPRAESYGFDLDGLCSDGKRAATLSCRRARNATNGAMTDGDAGIDNTLGRNLLDYLVFAYQRPSVRMSGFSYLETKSDGSGTLSLGTASGIQFVLPLVSVRISPPEKNGLRTLAAIAPRDALVASIRGRINLASGELACSTAAVESLVTSIMEAADIPVSGPPDAEAPCDGISIGLRLSSTPVATVPPIGAGCTAI